MSAGAMCEYKHAQAVHAWLCLTSKDNPFFHVHVCGTHVKPFRRMRRTDLVIRTIDADHPTLMVWLTGKGCPMPNSVAGVSDVLL